MADRLTRIAIINEDRCKPKKCRQECKKSCPVVKTGKLCIEVTPTSKTCFLSEELCIGCGICVKVIGGSGAWIEDIGALWSKGRDIKPKVEFLPSEHLLEPGEHLLATILPRDAC